MTSIDDALSQLRESTDPALTWYSGTNDRVELSGKVLDNWVAKSANLLLEDFDVEPGSTVAIHLPAHWKSLAITLAALAAGATVSATPDPGGASVVVSDDPRILAGADSPTLGVALGSLQVSFGDDLPAGGVDYAANVRMYADSFDRFRDPDPSQLALDSSWLGNSGAGVRYPDILNWAGAGGQRVAVCASVGIATAFRIAMGSWAHGGSLVLYASELGQPQRAKELATIVGQEQAQLL